MTGDADFTRVPGLFSCLFFMAGNVPSVLSRLLPGKIGRRAVTNPNKNVSYI